jgi:HTH DNA binding domain
MPDTRENDDENPFRPVWETDDELDPPGRPRAQKRAAEPDYDHPLLTPLARAQNALARLEAKAEMASPAVVEGLRARMSYLEAAGWLRYAHMWIHPADLALRESGGVTSYGAAARADLLATVLPSTVAQQADLEGVVATGAIGLDIAANQALKLAGSWRRLAELRTWRPVSNAEMVRKTLQSLGRGKVEEGVIEDWLAGVYGREKGPDLIRAGRAAADWRCQPGVKDRDPDGVFLAACLWHDKNRNAPIPIPFWTAPEQHHSRLDLRIGTDWMAEFLNCVAAAAMIGRRELERLLEAEKKRQSLCSTARSRLPDALDAVLRAPIVTPASLAAAIRVSPRGALNLLRELTAAGIVREATGRASWRAYALI